MDNQRLAQEMVEALNSTTDEDFEAAWAEMVKQGIIDEEGNVLKRFPEPPEWLTGKNGHTRSETPATTKKKAKRPRKRT
jgi:hypothetical protein